MVAQTCEDIFEFLSCTRCFLGVDKLIRPKNLFLNNIPD